MKSSNASASAFGWEFQSNAAIMLMLKNIEKAAKVKVEGETQDIEITFSDGKMLLSQAKAIFDPDDHSHSKEKLESGLRTLERGTKFISECWGNYKNYFDIKTADHTTVQTVVRLTLSNVLRSRKVISTIKGKVKL